MIYPELTFLDKKDEKTLIMEFLYKSNYYQLTFKEAFFFLSLTNKAKATKPQLLKEDEYMAVFDNSDFLNSFKQCKDFTSKSKHYVIKTKKNTFHILANAEPVTRIKSKEEVVKLKKERLEEEQTNKEKTKTITKKKKS